MSNNTKATVEEEEDAATVGGYHGYPVLMRTDMSEEMAYEVRSPGTIYCFHFK